MPQRVLHQISKNIFHYSDHSYSLIKMMPLFIFWSRSDTDLQFWLGYYYYYYFSLWCRAPASGRFPNRRPATQPGCQVTVNQGPICALQKITCCIHFGQLVSQLRSNTIEEPRTNTSQIKILNARRLTTSISITLLDLAEDLRDILCSRCQYAVRFTSQLRSLSFQYCLQSQPITCQQTSRYRSNTAPCTVSP